MDIDIRSVKTYWENYQSALEGEPWKFIPLQNLTEKDPKVTSSSFDLVVMEVINWLMVIGVVIIVIFVIFFMDNDNKVEDFETDIEAYKEPPPSYDDVIKQEEKELYDQQYLPSYLQAMEAQNNQYLLNCPDPSINFSSPTTFFITSEIDNR